MRNIFLVYAAINIELYFLIQVYAKLEIFSSQKNLTTSLYARHIVSFSVSYFSEDMDTTKLNMIYSNINLLKAV